MKKKTPYPSDFENLWSNSPTCPKFNTHNKVVLHFFILMLLLPKTPPLTYPNIKKFKGPKMDSPQINFKGISFVKGYIFQTSYTRHVNLKGISFVKGYIFQTSYTRQVNFKGISYVKGYIFQTSYTRQVNFKGISFVKGYIFQTSYSQGRG